MTSIQGTHVIRCKNGQTFQIQVPPPADIRSFFAFSLHKAGSTLMMNILADYCKYMNLPTLSPYSEAFSQGVSTAQIGNDLDRLLMPRGYGYLGFRHMLPYNSKYDFSRSTVFFLVRDPRDIIVSLYFSLMRSHPIPTRGSTRDEMLKKRQETQKLSIDEFALNNIKLVNFINNYIERLLKKHPVHIFKYEDIIFDKTQWLTDMVNKAQLPLNESAIERVAEKHDIRPEREDPNQHIRQVTPGNFRKHLSTETIRTLNDTFSEPMKHFGYQLH